VTVDVALTPEQAQIVAENTGLVQMLVTRAGVPAWDVDEAVQDGMIGLVKAAQRYRPELGYRFSTYAAHQIRGHMARGRGTREGINYRAAAAGRTGGYVRPVSTDHEAWEWPIADPDTNVEHEATVRAALEEATTKMLIACEDAIDVAIFVEMMQRHDTTGVADAVERAGHCSRHNARARLVRLRAAGRA